MEKMNSFRVLMMITMITAASSLQAQECVDAYRQADRAYHSALVRVHTSSYEIGAMGGVLGMSIFGCLKLTRSVPACIWGAAGGTLVLGGKALANRDEKELQALEDAHKLFTIYDDFKKGNHVGSAAREFVQIVGVDVQKEEDVLAELARQMENGELCEAQKPVGKIKDLVAKMRDYSRQL